MDEVKYAFQKVKQDMNSMKEEISSLSLNISQIQDKLNHLEEVLASFNQLKENATSELTSFDTPTNQHIIPTNHPISSANQHLFEPQRDQNYTFSTGNEGVPTDRQTNQQTNQQIFSTQNTPYFDKAISLLNSLDSIKKEIRSKFKKITDQEFLVFSLIYQLSDQGEYTDYKTLAQKLNLTESSVRDYVGKLIKKEIPIEKIKINNKFIQLKVSNNLKKIAPLPIILQLREI